MKSVEIKVYPPKQRGPLSDTIVVSKRTADQCCDVNFHCTFSLCNIRDAFAVRGKRWLGLASRLGSNTGSRSNLTSRGSSLHGVPRIQVLLLIMIFLDMVTLTDTKRVGPGAPRVVGEGPLDQWNVPMVKEHRANKTNFAQHSSQSYQSF